MLHLLLEALGSMSRLSASFWIIEDKDAVLLDSSGFSA